ncbi:MAG: hypothetical protein KBF29_08550, partial [Sterolibacterium sp.]|nr:hypothetical protein [Sterolibacterium sp.]
MTKTHLCSSPSRRPPLLAGWRVLMLAGCLHLPLLPLVVGPAHANDEDKVTLNFVNADIETVTKAVSQITGKNFLL